MGKGFNSSQYTKTITHFLTNIVDMIIPFQVRINGNTKVFKQVYLFKYTYSFNINMLNLLVLAKVSSSINFVLLTFAFIMLPSNHLQSDARSSFKHFLKRF